MNIIRKDIILRIEIIGLLFNDKFWEDYTFILPKILKMTRRNVSIPSPIFYNFGVIQKVESQA